jgi:hypothetical protein
MFINGPSDDAELNVIRAMEIICYIIVQIFNSALFHFQQNVVYKGNVMFHSQRTNAESKAIIN